MNKFKLATKKIVAVGTAVAVASSSALAAFPGMFVEDDKFMADVVVGADAAASDMTAAEALIASLETKYSGNSNMVEITATMRSEGGESVEFTESGDTWNFGESNNDVRDSAFDDSDLSILSEDLTFDNGFSDEDYTEEIVFDNNAMTFEHTLRDDHSNEISTHLFIDNGASDYIARYTFELDSDLVGVNGGGQEGDFVGEELTILGVTYTITEVGFSGTSGIDKLGLIGGANKIALGEGESTTVDVDGNSYEVSVQSVSDDEVLMTVNGQSVSIDEFDTEEVAGISIAATDLVSSSRDSVKGYAEIVIGGQEIIIENGQEVTVNDEDISDLHEDYKVTAAFQGTGNDFTGFTLTYSTDETDGILLEAGEAWEDMLFGAFSVVYDGTNNVDYSTVELSVSGDKVSLTGELESGEDFDEEIAHAVDDTTSTDTAVRLIGADEDTPLLLDDITFGAGVNVALAADDSAQVADTSLLSGSTEYVVYEELGGTPAQYDAEADRAIYAGTADEIATLFDLTGANVNVDGIFMTEADSGLRFIAGDVDDQVMYEVSAYDVSDAETSIDDVFAGNSVTEDRANADVASKLDDVTTFTITSDVLTALAVDLDTTFTSELAFAEELLVDLSGVTSFESASSQFSFDYDEADLDVDDNGDATMTVTVGMSWDDNDEELVLGTPTGSEIIDFGSGTSQDTMDGDDDMQEFVTKYGTKFSYDNDEGSMLTIETPDEQVEAKVMLVTGGSSAETRTWTVSEDEVESTKSDLIADGWTIVSENEMSTEDVEFMVEGVTLDVDADVAAGNHIVIGGPAVNAAARAYLGIDMYDVSQAGVEAGEGVARVFEEENSVLIYGYSAEDTTAIVNEVIAGTANFQ